MHLYYMDLFVLLLHALIKLHQIFLTLEMHFLKIILILIPLLVY